MVPDFPGLFGRCLTARGMTVREFAQKAGVARSFVQSVRSGRRRVPLARVPTWADLLGLQGAKRTEFLDAAYLSHVLREVRAWFSGRLGRSPRGSRHDSPA
jgi:transcriptional regulator with XRE-family HTH domain